jgi:DNA-binding SARP family transcriptional activator
MLEIRLLGQFGIRRAGQPVRLPMRAAQSLLAYLLLNPGLPLRREKLAGLFWPNLPEAAARGNLRHALWRVRQALAPCPATGRDYILGDELTLTLDPAAELWLDTRLLAAPLDETPALDTLLRAVEVYRGEFLPGFYDDWTNAERERLQAAYESRMALLLEQLSAANRWLEVLDWSARWLALGGVPEPAYRAVMRAHAAQGDQAQVVAAFQRCRDALREGLGVPPSEQTRALYESLMQRPAPAPRPTPAGPAPTPDSARGYGLPECLG